MAITSTQLRNSKVNISSERSSIDDVVQMGKDMGLSGSESFTLVTVTMNTLLELLALKDEENQCPDTRLDPDEEIDKEPILKDQIS